MIINDPVEKIELQAKAFEIGVKDVLSIQSISLLEHIASDLKSKGFLFKEVQSKYGSSNLFFFRSKKELLIFENEFELLFVEGKAREMCTEYGLFMGYPPKACEYFPKKSFDVDFVENIIINYNGMFFASYPETIEDDFNWLFENKPLGEESFVLIEHKSYLTNNINWKSMILGDLEYFKGPFLEIKKTRCLKK